MRILKRRSLQVNTLASLSRERHILAHKSLAITGHYLSIAVPLIGRSVFTPRGDCNSTLRVVAQVSPAAAILTKWIAI